VYCALGQYLVTTLSRHLAKTHGLFLFFKESCPYCHAFAPIVKQFRDTYGFKVKAVSYDGGSLKEFPEACPDNGAIRKLNPYMIFPALLLVNPEKGEVIPLSWGMNAISVLEQQANLVFETLVKDKAHEDIQQN
jgi:conjugal transfer pilus assembly protein TraF